MSDAELANYPALFHATLAPPWPMAESVDIIDSCIDHGTDHPCFFARVATGECFPVYPDEITPTTAVDSVRCEQMLTDLWAQVKQ